MPDEKNKLLIIDDEEAVAEILEAFLEDDFDCTICFGGEEAIEAINSNKYNLIITDLEMPNVNGFDIIAHIQTLEYKPVVLISTGHGEEDPEVKKALEAGAQGAIVKPFNDTEKLIETLNSYLK